MHLSSESFIYVVYVYICTGLGCAQHYAYTTQCARYGAVLVKLCLIFVSFDAEPVVELEYWEESDRNSRKTSPQMSLKF